MKVLSAFLIILAVFVSVFPQFTDCQSQGAMITLADGRQISMKCHWTARAELVVGIPLLVVGAALFMTRRKETRIALGVLGLVLGVLAILLPTVLIGVCMSAGMICNLAMKPALILSGSLVILISLAITLVSALKKENTPPA